MFGTKCPSITSRCSQSAPAATTSRTSSPRRAKSAARIDGAMRIGSVKVTLRFLAQRGLRRCFPSKHTACQQISSINYREILSGDLATPNATNETIRLAQTSAVKGIANGASVSEMRLRLTGDDVTGQGVASRLV